MTSNNKVISKIEPIRFDTLDYLGETGRDRFLVMHNLSKLFTQNILYAAYYEPKTPGEISEITGLPKAVVEEEIHYLEKNGFMDQVSKNKYLTYFYITDLSDEVKEKKHNLYMNYAKIICDKYIPVLFEACRDILRKPDIKKSIYYPHNDFNFLMWSVVMFALGHKLEFDDPANLLEKFMIKRTDGSSYLPLTTIIREASLSENNDDKYKAFGEVLYEIKPPELYPMLIWTLNTYYDDRIDDISQVMIYEYADLYDIMKNRIIDHNEVLPLIEAVYKRGFIIKDKEDYVNMVLTTLSKDEFCGLLPDIPAEFRDLSNKLDTEVFNLIKSEYPPHILELCQIITKKSIISNEIKTRVLEILLENETLLPLTEIQRKTVCIMMFSSVLPGDKKLELK